VDLREGTFDRLRRPGQPEPACRDDSECDDDGLVVVEHQRGKPVAGAYAVAASYPSLALDRNAELLQRGDVAPDGSAIDP